MTQFQNTHGGDIYLTAKRLGRKPNEILDFSANINPLGVPKCVKLIIEEQLDNLINYPDFYCTDIKNDISKYLDIDSKSIIVGNGASEIIYLVLEALNCKKVLLPAPSFSEYRSSLEKLKIPFEYFEMKDENDFLLDIDQLKSTLQNKFDVLLICNPNNPTSKLINKEVLLDLINWAENNGVFVIIDEAFIELTIGANDNSIVSLTKSFKNLFVIRAFTKVFAIPGLRLGYGIGDKALIELMWKNKLPWSVNTFSSMIGPVLEDEEKYLEKTANWLEEEIEWFYNKLCKINKFYVFKPFTNFILIKLLDTTLNSGSLKDILSESGILIRDASNFMFLNDRFIRIAVKDRNSNMLFLTAVESLSELGLWGLED